MTHFCVQPVVKRSNVEEDEAKRVAVAKREEEIIGMMQEMVDQWEADLGDDDRTLYSLGLRRAIERIKQGC
jgi:hypothetical protein